MATVYHAVDLKHRRRVAIKVLRPEFSATIGAERFLREIEIAARLQHPHILPLLDSGEAAGMLYLVMPLVEGETLRARLARENRLSIPDVVRIVADVADALAYAHAKGIIHRDIKPDNIMLSGRHALVMDFGVAKALAEGQRPEGGQRESAAAVLTGEVALGTPAYMAPEQAMADPALDHRVDLYALGVLAYELLAGRPPFTGMAPQEMLTAQVVVTPESIESFRADLSPALGHLIMKCLAKRPAERWQTAEELLAALEPMATPSGGITPHATTPIPGGSFWRDRRLGALGLIGAAVVVGAILLLWPGSGHPASAQLRQKQITFDGRVLEAALSPDAELVAYVTQADDGQHLMVQDLRGGSALQVASGKLIRAPHWSLDGSEIFCSTISNQGLAALVAVPRLGGEPRTVSTTANSVSPDGTRLALFTPHGRRIALVPTGGGDTTWLDLKSEHTWNVDVAWSARNDRLLLFTSTPARGRVGLLVLAADGTAQREILDSSFDLRGPVWSPDGGAIYFFNVEGTLASLMRVPIGRQGGATDSPQSLLSGLELRDLKDGNPMVSLDRSGQRMVYVRESARSNLALARLGPSGLRVEPLTTGTAMHLFPSLSPDRRRLAFLRGESRGFSLNLMSLSGGAQVKIAEMLEGYGIAWSPDGRSLAFITRGTGRDFGIAISGTDGLHPQNFALGRVSTNLVWRRDGTIVFQPPSNQGLMRLNPATGQESRVAEVDSTAFVHSLRLSPDGRTLAFLMRGSPAEQGLYLLSDGDREPRLVDSGEVLTVGWDIEGRTLFGVRPAGSQPAALYAYRDDRPPGRLAATLPPGLELQEAAGPGTLIGIQEDRSADVWLLEASMPAP